MMRFFSGTINHCKPNPKQNCFQNYWDHLNHIEQDSYGLWNRVDSKNWFKTIASEAYKHVNMFKALRDGHDYTDEVVGVVAGATLYTAVATGLLGVAIWEGCCGLLMKAGLIKDDGKSHGENVLKALLFFAAALIMSVVVYIKSVISLITRPLVTALVGWKPQDTPRFCDKDARQDIPDAPGLKPA